MRYLVLHQLMSVRDELDAAAEAHPRPMASTHEAYAVIKEELDEFWDEVRKKRPDPAALREELVQIAAMAVRALEDLGL